MNSTNKLETMPIGKLIWNVSFPLMVSMLVQSLYNIVDGLFVAKISEDALTATSLAYPVQILMIAIAVGTGVGTSTLLSRSLGQHDEKKVQRVAANGLFAAVCGFLPFLLLGIFAVRPFLSLYETTPEIFNDSASYLRICMIFSLGIFVATTGERCLQATGKTWLSMAAQTAGAVCNIILDPIFIFGWLGIPAMGVVGAAVATVVGQWLAAIVSLWLNQRYNREVSIRLKGFHVDRGILKEIYKIGLPTMVMQALGSVMVLCMNSILYLFSSTAVAFFGVYYKLQNFLYMPLNGLAQGLIPIVAYNSGANCQSRVKSSYKVGVLGAASIMLAGTLVFCLFPSQLLSIFDAGTEMLAIGVPAMRIISATFVFAGITVTTGYYFTGLGNGLVNMISTLLRYIVILLPAAYLFSCKFGITGTWYAFWLSEIIACGFSLCFYFHKRKAE
ncbi:MAG: MATE family efflux transporter [Oscillospiraceae bacterium]